MQRKILWLMVAILSLIIGLYPGLYFIGESKTGILKTKPDELFLNPFWNLSFYTHIILGGLALLVGWTQFNHKIRKSNMPLHRKIGIMYIIAVLLSSLSGFHIAFYATAGLFATLGFITLSIIWFYTTLMAFLHVKRRQLLLHSNMITYSYACCFAAVTLRFWLPFLNALLGNFETAYIVVAWWCWIPNLTIAHFLIKKSTKVT
jgi:hypothetical protein